MTLHRGVEALFSSRSDQSNSPFGSVATGHVVTIRNIDHVISPEGAAITAPQAFRSIGKAGPKEKSTDFGTRCKQGIDARCCLVPAGNADLQPPPDVGWAEN